MNIKKSLLDIVREKNNTDISHMSMVNLCFYQILREPLFSRFKNFQIINDGGNFKLKRGFNNKGKALQGLLEFYSDKSGDYESKKNLSGEIYIEGEVLEDLNKLKNLLKTTEGYRELIEEVKKELKINPLFLVKLKTLNNSGVENFIDTLGCFLKLPKNMVVDKNCGIELFLRKSASNKVEEKIEIDFFYARDELSAMFINKQLDYKSKHERLDLILESDFNFIKFIDLCGVSREQVHNEKILDSEKKKRDFIKNLYKNNKFARDFFNKDSEHIFRSALDLKWEGIKEKIESGINRVNCDSLEVLIKGEYGNKISDIVYEFHKRHPFLKEPKIDKSKVEFELYFFEKGKSGVFEIKSQDDFNFTLNNNYPVEIIEIKDPLEGELDNWETIESRREALFFERLNETDLSLNLNLFEQDSGRIFNNDAGIFINMKYEGLRIGSAKLSKQGDWGYEVMKASIVDVFQGQGLGTMLYNFMSEALINNKMVMRTEMYTEDGFDRIIGIKKKIAEKNKDFVYAEGEFDYDEESGESNIVAYCLDLLIRDDFFRTKNLNFEDIKYARDRLLEREPQLREEIRKGEGNYFSAKRFAESKVVDLLADLINKDSKNHRKRKM